jgi:hypothetical protein
MKKLLVHVLKQEAFTMIQAKRFFTAALTGITAAVVTGMLAGCSSAAFAPDLNKGYRMTADITYGDISARANLARNYTGEWTVTFAEPYSLSGVEWIYSNGTLTTEYDGVAAANTADSVGVQMIDALENAVAGSDGNRHVSSSGGDIAVSGENYTLIVDRSSATPIALSMPGALLEVTFSNVKTARLSSGGAVPGNVPDVDVIF